MALCQEFSGSANKQVQVVAILLIVHVFVSFCTECLWGTVLLYTLLSDKLLLNILKYVVFFLTSIMLVIKYLEGINVHKFKSGKCFYAPKYISTLVAKLRLTLTLYW